MVKELGLVSVAATLTLILLILAHNPGPVT